MRFNDKSVLIAKLKESLSSVLPTSIIVFILCFYVISVPTDILMAFVMGTIMLVLGMGLFTLGTDLAMTPVGEHVGSAVTKSRKLWFIILIGFLVGCIITISEPDLQVLANQVPNIEDMVIILSVAIGVGVFLVFALLRIVFKLKLSYLLVFFYIIVFSITFFIPREFLPVAFDAGGVTTGPMTVPFIMALGVGVASIRTDKNAENDSFGLVSLCSVGPIISVLILGLLFNTGKGTYTPLEIKQIPTSIDLWKMFTSEIPHYMAEVSMALLPIILFFLVFQLFGRRLHKESVIRISVGFIYTYIGLVLFLCGVNVGFMPVGNFIGTKLAELTANWVIVPIGMIIGYFIVSAEPAVHVLNKQVYEMTSGAIPKKALSTSLSIGVSISIGLSMLRIVLGIPLVYMLVPGYLIAIVLSFFVPPMFTAIAFDSGGVASGPMTATFLLPLAMGATSSLGRDITSYAFGVVAMVAMTPLITIQLLGLYFKLKERSLAKQREKLIATIVDSEIIE